MHHADARPDLDERPRAVPGRLRARHLIGATVAAALLSASVTAFATDTFPDVPNAHAFHDEINWLADTGITGGFGDGTFRPGQAVTRGSMAAFLQRYYQLTAGLHGVHSNAATRTITSTSMTSVDAQASVVIPEGTRGRIIATFSGASRCHNVGGTELPYPGQCRIRLLLGGTPMNGNSTRAFDSVEPGELIQIFGTAATESHSITRYSDVLDPGPHTVAVQAAVTPSEGVCIPVPPSTTCIPPSGATTFYLEDTILTLQVELVDLPR